jgi:hypothetical protein
MMQPVKFICPNIYILLQLYALILVSVADAERSLSILKLIETKLLNQTGDERLSNLTVITINKNTAQELNAETIIDEFAKSKRRISFTSKSNWLSCLIIFFFDFLFL